MTDYLVSLTVSAIVCAVVVGVTGSKGTIASIVKLLSGLFMTVMLVKPLIDIKIPDLLYFTETLSEDGAILAQDGQMMAAEEMDRIIKERVEAYILSKAESLSATIDVRVELQDHVPVQVYLDGAVSPYAKGQLSAYMKEVFNISPEAQIWNGQ